ncbi:hypothetical protein ACFY3O_36240 [Streptomyces sp. NPDC001046]|uniref:hypothetical protein n=1 Tax=Streptomyces sp. NPDC001046 TaxID=3364543 RepID=UPI00368D2C88
MEKVQEMLAPEGVIALLAAVAAVGAREWRRLQLAREKRRVREQELLAAMVADVAGGRRDVHVRHGGGAEAWSLNGTGHGEERAVLAADSRTTPARRRR